MNIIVIFAVLLGIFVTVCSGDQEPLQIEKSVDSLSNVVNTYGNDLNEKFKPEELQKAINMVDSSMLGYGGSAKNYLDDIRRLNSNASLTYKNSRDLILECCTSLSSTLQLFIQNTKKRNHQENEQNIILNITFEALKTGASKINESLNLLENAQYTRRILKEKLDTMDSSLKTDLMNEISKEKPEIKGTIFQIIWNFLKKLWNKLFYPKVEEEKAVEDNKIKIAKIEENIKNATIVIETSFNLDFAEDKTNINEMTRFLSVSDPNKLLLDANAKWEEKLMPRVDELLKSCNSFSKSQVQF
ncbi:uncharacterized protein [Drosophila bipectinata]|uniref:uncharacterized protein n=1 Tax=Drosophila bipectinata TaxID=42026 RepID=UPI0038B2FB1E